jgi:hypothetical protein
VPQQVPVAAVASGCPPVCRVCRAPLHAQSAVPCLHHVAAQCACFALLLLPCVAHGSSSCWKMDSPPHIPLPVLYPRAAVWWPILRAGCSTHPGGASRERIAPAWLLSSSRWSWLPVELLRRQRQQLLRWRQQAWCAAQALHLPVLRAASAGVEVPSAPLRCCHCLVGGAAVLCCLAASQEQQANTAAGVCWHVCDRVACGRIA